MTELATSGLICYRKESNSIMAIIARDVAMLEGEIIVIDIQLTVNQETLK